MKNAKWTMQRERRIAAGKRKVQSNGKHGPLLSRTLGHALHASHITEPASRVGLVATRQWFIAEAQPVFPKTNLDLAAILQFTEENLIGNR
jgi:hypothetical protein